MWSVITIILRLLLYSLYHRPRRFRKSEMSSFFYAAKSKLIHHFRYVSAGITDRVKWLNLRGPTSVSAPRATLHPPTPQSSTSSDKLWDFASEYWRWVLYRERIICSSISQSIRRPKCSIGWTKLGSTNSLIGRPIDGQIILLYLYICYYKWLMILGMGQWNAWKGIFIGTERQWQGQL